MLFRSVNDVMTMGRGGRLTIKVDTETMQVDDREVLRDLDDYELDLERDGKVCLCSLSLSLLLSLSPLLYLHKH